MALELIEAGRSFPLSLKDGLAGYWKMDEPAWDGTPDELKDYSGNGNHGVMIGAAGTVNSGPGKLGNCFEANGLNAFSVPPGVFNQDAGTWSCWVQSDSATQNWTFRLFGTDHSAGQGFEHRTFYNGVSTALIWQTYTESGLSLTSSLPSTFSSGTWARIAFTWEYDSASGKTTVQSYLNGVAGAPVSNNGKLAMPDIAVWLGLWIYYLATPAKMDSFAVWNRLLSPAEIIIDYNGGAGRDILLDDFSLPLDMEDLSPALEVTEV